MTGKQIELCGNIVSMLRALAGGRATYRDEFDSVIFFFGEYENESYEHLPYKSLGKFLRALEKVTLKEIRDSEAYQISHNIVEKHKLKG